MSLNLTKSKKISAIDSGAGAFLWLVQVAMETKWEQVF